VVAMGVMVGSHRGRQSASKEENDNAYFISFLCWSELRAVEHTLADFSVFVEEVSDVWEVP
jgi:hypothetical protein